MRWIGKQAASTATATAKVGASVTGERKMAAEAAAEMEIRGAEDIEIGQDVTPPLPPLASSLYDSFLSSHCSSCFSLLPSTDALPPSPPPPPFRYCSNSCALSDPPLHHLSYAGKPPLDTSDIRTAVRLLRSTSTTSPHRIGSLLTNRHRLMSDPTSSLTSAIREAAAAMRMLQNDSNRDDRDNDLVLEEEAICSVITNAVEVTDETGRALGIAVYGGAFSWINHSCTPNACYRFVLDTSVLVREDPRRLLLVPQIQGEIGVSSNVAYEEGKKGYGPRLIVRSIKRIKKGEEITVSYTDLLQPKALRQSDLWSKYQFVCCCRRCAASPPAYVDSVLEGIYTSKWDFIAVNNAFCKDEANRNMTDYVEEAISEYLSEGDPESCCEKIEHVLNHGLPGGCLQGIEGNSQLNFRMHPLHHAALNAYTTLASTYKIRSSYLTPHYSESNGDLLEAFNMSRASAAYSLFLAGATHHLFSSESSLIISAANFWTNAGESLLILAQSPAWELLFAKWESLVSTDLPSLAKLICTKCSLMDPFEANLSRDSALKDLEELSCKFLNCVTNTIEEIWSFLVNGCHYLQKFRNPTDFSWLEKPSGIHEFESSSSRINGNSHEAEGYTDKERVRIFQLGMHCLFFGGILTNICYGLESHSTCHLHKLLHDGENLLHQLIR